jgi:hypothetical protein
MGDHEQVTWNGNRKMALTYGQSEETPEDIGVANFSKWL